MHESKKITSDVHRIIEQSIRLDTD